MTKDVAIGIDIGGTNTIAGLVTLDGSVIKTSSINTTDYPLVEDFVTALADMTGELAGGDDYNLIGIGIGAPNGNYLRGTIEHASNLAWKGIIPLGEMLEKAAGVPVSLTNDANAAALGEMLFGGAKGMKDFAVLTLGTGLGSGIVVNSEVLYGSTGFAGEYGHTIVFPGGRDCGCGRQGCLETYVSATGLVRTVQFLMGESMVDSPLRQISQAKLTSKDVAEAAASGDGLALEAFDYTAEILANAIVNLVTITSPEALFLFGGLAGAGKLLFDPVLKYTDELVPEFFRDTFRILPSAISGSNAAVLGAAALAWKRAAGINEIIV